MFPTSLSHQFDCDFSSFRKPIPKKLHLKKLKLKVSELQAKEML